VITKAGLTVYAFLCEWFQILTELEHSGVGRNKEQAARMLGLLVANASRLIRPYMEPILKVTLYRLCHG